VLGRDGVAGLVCLAGSLWLLALTAGLPRPALVPIGPGFYPRIVLAVTAALSAALLIADVRGRRRRDAPPAAPSPPNRRLVWLTFAIFSAYVFALPILGYRIATFCFVAALSVALEPAGRRRFVRTLLVAAVTAALTHLVFEGYLSVLLPRSRWLGI
jgi:hypothetical protein